MVVVGRSLQPYYKSIGQGISGMGVTLLKWPRENTYLSL